MKWGIYQNKISAIIATFILLIFSYILLFFNAEKLSTQTVWIAHTYSVIEKLDKISSENNNFEYNFNGYITMRHELFRSRLYENMTRIDSVWKNIKILTEDNQGQQDRLDTLRKLLDEKFTNLTEAVSTMSNQPKNEVLEDSLLGKYYGSENGTRVKQVIADTERHEEELLDMRMLKMERFSRTIKIINLVSLLLAFSFAIAAFLVYKKEYEIRKGITLQSEEYRTELEERVKELDNANKEIKEYKQVEKFASTGRISRTIAHEVRNPLTNINLAAEQLKESIPATEENELLLNLVARNSMRINQLISNLLNATKFTELIQEEVSINELLEDALSLAGDRINLKRVKVSKNFDRDICRIKVDPEKIKIALLNIIVNAIESMPESGGHLKINTSKKDDYCFIEFTDNGSGMDEETLAKVFEPYFTNKENGNGLGLTNTQNVILNHKGKIEVASNPGEGTRFMVYLLI